MLTELVFYDLIISLEMVLPSLVEKAYVGKKRCIICVEDTEQCAKWNTLLWTYSTLTFLPHASDAQHLSEERISMQPIFITAEKEKWRNAEIIFNFTQDFIQPFAKPTIQSEVSKASEKKNDGVGKKTIVPNENNNGKPIEKIIEFLSSRSDIIKRFEHYKELFPVDGILWRQQENGWTQEKL
jgi:DNA polymerase IIIc chi subunit